MMAAIAVTLLNEVFSNVRAMEDIHEIHLRDQLGIDPETVLHLLVGGLTRRKNHEVGIAAIEQRWHEGDPEEEGTSVEEEE